MKCFIVFIGLLAICLAATETDKKDEVKSKRQIHQGRLGQSQAPPSPRQYIIRAAGQSEQLQEFSPEYLNLLQELSAHQEQQQQETIQTIKKPQQHSGHRFQQYQIPAGSQYSYPQLKPQSEGQSYQEAEYLTQLNRKPQIETKKQQSLKITPSQGYNVQPTPAAIELQTHFSTADYESYQAALQQQLEQQQPINHQPNSYISQTKQSNHPLAESSLEKEIAKLIASNKAVEPFSGQKQQLQSYRAPTSKPKSQPKPEIYSQQKYQYLQPQSHQQVHPSFTSPHPHPHRFAYIAPALQNYNPTEEVPQYHENPNKIQNTEYQYLQKEYAQQQAQQQAQQHQQQPQHKIQYAPIEEKPQPQVTYDRSNVMKVIEAPQFDKPQSQQFYLKPEQSAIQQQQELYQKAIDSQTIEAPSHSSIYVSQSTGLPKQRPQQRKHEVNQQRKVQHEKNQQAQSAQEQESQEPNHNHHHHHRHQPQQQQQPQHQEQQQKSPSLRHPPPTNGEPITQEEFQALVDAGYSVQAIPIHVPVPVEEYQKHIERQSKRKNSYQYQPLHFQQQQPQQQDEQSESYSRPTEYGRPVKGAGKNKH